MMLLKKTGQCLHQNPGNLPSPWIRLCRIKVKGDAPSPNCPHLCLSMRIEPLHPLPPIAVLLLATAVRSRVPQSLPLLHPPPASRKPDPPVQLAAQGLLEMQQNVRPLSQP